MEEQLEAGVGEAAALGAMASLAASQGGRAAEVVKRLETLGSDGERARMEAPPANGLVIGYTEMMIPYRSI